MIVSDFINFILLKATFKLQHTYIVSEGASSKEVSFAELNKDYKLRVIDKVIIDITYSSLTADSIVIDADNINFMDIPNKSMYPKLIINIILEQKEGTVNET